MLPSLLLFKHRVYHEMLEFFYKLKEEGPASPQFALCANFQIHCILDKSDQFKKAAHNELRGIFESWEHFSGNHNYPIPGNSRKDAMSLFRHYDDSGKDFWSKKTKYGQLRWKLVDHAIRKLEFLERSHRNGMN